MIEQLKQARDLIANGWCRGAYAKDESNKPVPPNDPSACKFCLYGALRKVTGMGNEFYKKPEYEELCEIMRKQLGGALFLDHFNDSKKNKRDVVRVFDKAIASLEK